MLKRYQSRAEIFESIIGTQIVKEKNAQEFELGFFGRVILALSEIWSILKRPGTLLNISAHLQDGLQPNLARIYPNPPDLRE